MLHVVTGCAHDAAAAEAYHVGAPAGIVFIHEDGCVGCQFHHVGVVLHAHHIDCLSQGGVHVAQISVAICHGILAHIYLRALTVVGVIFVECCGKPVWGAVVVFVKQIYGQLAVPFRIVVAPCHHVADDFHVGVFGTDGFVELLIALVVVVALLARVGLVVFVAHLQIFQSERFGMPILGAHGTIFGCDGTVGIFDGIHALVNPGLDAIVGCHAAMPQTHVDHIERLGAQVLCQLQIFVIAQPVRGAVAPVHVPVSLTLFYRPDGAFPAESVVGTLLPLHKAASGEAHELRVHLPQHVGQIGTHAVLTVLERRREKAHHIKLHLSHAVENQGELCFRVVVVGCERGFVLRPAFCLG